MAGQVRDIIEAARSDSVWTRSGHKGCDIVDGSNRTSDCDDILFVNDEREDWSGLGVAKDPYFVAPEAVAEFVVALQPEHALLMDHVAAAAHDLVQARKKPPSAHGYIAAAMTALECCSERLEAYRREHGLT